MLGYFKNFQSILYALDQKELEPKVLTNILQRSSFLKEVVNNTAFYYTYQMKEEDTPEIIADKLYGDPQRHWIVLLFNKIMNPYYDLPMKSDALDTYIQAKYNQTLSQSQSTLHHYELEITKTISVNGFVDSQDSQTFIVNEYEVDYTTGQLTARTVPGTIDSSLTSPPEIIVFADGTQIQTVEKITAVSNYSYEVAQNELRKTIILLDARYVQKIEDEFTKLMSND